uniref:Uncharacterized protein n=1 Tax=Anguilla anguilla TaxID=7936 RepID=A0A0E9TG29_ANGAN
MYLENNLLNRKRKSLFTKPDKKAKPTIEL